MGTTLIGRLVGPFSDRPASGSLIVPSGDGTDFAIGGLAFRVAVGDNRPYQRATADFRKEQFDSQSDVGDQSLTGWWKRGQLSFHKGAGVEFYEVLDGKAVSDRFSASVDVAVDDPGVVTLAPSWEALSTPPGLRYGVLTRNGYTAYLTEGGEVYTSATPGAYAPVGGVATAVAQGPDDEVFVATTLNTIEGTTTALAAGTVNYTHDTAIAQMWFGKGRLWVLDTSSRLYQLAPTPSSVPVAIATSDLVCTFTETTTPWPAPLWSFAESPAAVYFGHATGAIYAVTVSNDGSLPTLAAPVEVARVPLGDPLRALGYYLGSLILQTASGVRTATFDSNGSVVMGPQFLDLTTTYPSTITGVGNRAWLVADDGVYSLDLSQLIDDANLTYAWVLEHAITGQRGVANEAGTIVVYGDDGRHQRDTSVLSQTGYLSTGQHRFGTLEPKQFHAVRVLVSGPGGTVAISRVDPSGAVTSLHTVDVSRSSEIDLTLSLTSPGVSVGLRFDLAQDADGNAPILHGYQLRALPAPRRQRLIRVPLQLFDVEGRRPTRSHGGHRTAASRLFALEEMEESGGTFVFQDFRTGEAGTCFIEKIEHEGSTPPSPGESGFGGIVYLTLRKLA